MQTVRSVCPLFRASGSRRKLLKLFLLAVALALPAVAWAGNLTGRYTTITLHGSLSDWQPGDTMYSVSEIGAGAPLNSTFTNVSAANDSTNLYIVLQLPAAAAITNTWTYNVYLDTDMNPATGFNAGWMGAGYDGLVQDGETPPSAADKMPAAA